MTPLLANPWILAAASGIGGGLVTVIVSRVIGKRGLFTYNVWHDRVAVATDDAAFGSVRVLWGEQQVANLFLSTVELRNESLRDFTNVTARVWSPTSNLLTERSEIAGTTHSLHWTEEYAALLALPPGVDATDTQLRLWNSQRDYNIPTMNRGQVVRISILNSVRGPGIPELTLEILHPGVRVKFRAVPQVFLGVPQPAAALTGTISGLVVVPLVASLVQSPLAAAVLAFVYGVVVLIPGALILRLARRVREWMGD
ncbi:MAG: hypothetical protein P3A58_06330 [Gemmatimonadota bacterium]|nr:hypothetical protein [Gemmatimonadota bacterium]